MSSANHRDSFKGISSRRESMSAHFRKSTPQPKTPRLSEDASRRSSYSNSPGASGLIVSRGLYDVLEKELQENARTASPVRRSTPKGPSSRPNFLFCYLCGRQFGSTSLQIHQPQCYVKKMIEWERMDPTKRGTKPLDPVEHGKRLKEKTLLGSTQPHSSAKARSVDVDRFNDFQMQEFNSNMLHKCDNCGRTFLPDRLEIHQRSCKAGSPGASKPVHRHSKSVAPCGRTPGASPVSFSSKSNSPAGEAAASCNPPPNANSLSTRTLPSGLIAEPEARSAQSCPTTPLLEKDPLATTRPGRGNSPLLDFAAMSSHESRSGARSPRKEVVEIFIEEADTTTRESSMKPKSQTVGRSPTAAVVARKSERSSVSLPNASIDNSSGPPLRVVNSAGNTPHEKCFDGTNSPLDETCDVEPPETVAHEHKIQLNNVSRFKHVQSRIKLDRKKSAEELPRCRYCNRTFNRDRLEKHEEFCIERNRPQHSQRLRPSTAPPGKAAAASATRISATATPGRKPVAAAEERKKSVEASTTDKKAAKETGEVTDAKEGAKAPDTPVEKSGAPEDTVKLLFCFHCGVKLRPDGQRFCSACGTKLA